MADENIPEMNEQNKSKITVKLKPLALKKAAGSDAAAPATPAAPAAAPAEAPAAPAIPVAPAGAAPSSTVKFTKPSSAAAAAGPDLPSAQELARQTIKLARPPKTGLPKPPAPMPSAAPAPAAPAPNPAPAAAPAPAPEADAKPIEAKPEATQAIKKPVINLSKPAAPAAPAPEADAKPVEAKPEATQAVKKPAINLSKPAAPAAPAPEPDAKPVEAKPEATQAVKKPALSLPPKKEASASAPTLHLSKSSAQSATPAAGAPTIHLKKPEAPADNAASAPTIQMNPPSTETDAEKVQREGLKPRSGGGKGFGLKAVKSVGEEKLPESLKADGEKLTGMPGKKEKGSGRKDEPGGFFTLVNVLALLLLLACAYVMFAQFADLWMPEMDANKLPVPILKK